MKSQAVRGVPRWRRGHPIICGPDRDNGRESMDTLISMPWVGVLSEH